MMRWINLKFVEASVYENNQCKDVGHEDFARPTSDSMINLYGVNMPTTTLETVRVELDRWRGTREKSG